MKATDPANTPPARTRPILMMSFVQKSGEPGWVPRSLFPVPLSAKTGEARAMRSRDTKVGKLIATRRMGLLGELREVMSRRDALN